MICSAVVKDDFSPSSSSDLFFGGNPMSFISFHLLFLFTLALLFLTQNIVIESVKENTVCLLFSALFFERRLTTS